MLIQILLPLFIFASTAIVSAAQNLNAALLKAAEAGDTARVEALLAQGADINAKNDVRETPLSVASFRGHLEIVKILIAKGGDLNQACPLCQALREGRVFGKKTFECSSCLAVAELLIEIGANLNATNGLGNTPLHIATQWGHLSIAKLLLAKGASVNAKGHFGSAPLHYAAEEGFVSLAEFLLANGADVNLKNQFGKTPLDVATADDAPEGAANVAALLIEKGASLKAANDANKTLLHITAAKGQLQLVRTLLAKGVDVNAKDKFGYTALHYAAKEGHLPIAEALIAKGARVNAENTFGKAPLDLAKDDNMIQLLTKAGQKQQASARQGRPGARRQPVSTGQRAQAAKSPNPLMRMKGTWTMTWNVYDLGPRKGTIGFGFGGGARPTSQQVIDQPDPDTISFKLDSYALTLKRDVKTNDYAVTLLDPARNRRLIDNLTLAYSVTEGFFTSSETEDATPYVNIKFEGVAKHVWLIKIESPNPNHSLRKYSITFTKP
ncbi:MAG: ankyrin repeat domain-containing protein [Blastocatellia bacterium]